MIHSIFIHYTYNIYVALNITAFIQCLQNAGYVAGEGFKLKHLILRPDSSGGLTKCRALDV